MGFRSREMTPRDARIMLLIFGLVSVLAAVLYPDVLGSMLRFYVRFWEVPAALWPAYGVLVVPAYFAWHACRRPRKPPARVGDGHCPQCDYDLRHTRTRCPECGHWINPPHLKEYR